MLETLRRGGRKGKAGFRYNDIRSDIIVEHCGLEN